MDLKVEIADWKVCRIYNNSDHHSINFRIRTEIIEIPAGRNYSKANWDILSKELDAMTIYIPEVISERKLDKMVEKVNACIELALDKACPILPAKIVNKNNPWWTSQLEELRKQVTNSYKKYITNQIEGNRTRYKKTTKEL